MKKWSLIDNREALLRISEALNILYHKGQGHSFTERYNQLYDDCEDGCTEGLWAEIEILKNKIRQKLSWNEAVKVGFEKEEGGN